MYQKFNTRVRIYRVNMSPSGELAQYYQLSRQDSPSFGAIWRTSVTFMTILIIIKLV